MEKTMTILVLSLENKSIKYTYFDHSLKLPLKTGMIKYSRSSNRSMESYTDSMKRIRLTCNQINNGSEPDVIAFHVSHGGAVFSSPIFFDADTTELLEDLIPESPLHLPPQIMLIKSCSQCFGDIPIVLVFETTFFSDLPPREHLYGLDTDLSNQLNIRRYGFHGIYHEAAQNHFRGAFSEKKSKSRERILSICLEPQMEIAAVMHHHPVMLTSGTTPLEGIPGNSTCGYLDPSIVLTLSKKMKWGPEQINKVLSRQSGLQGLTGKPSTLKTLYDSTDDASQKARDIIQYRILQESGAGIAAMGGLDGIVFSGRYVEVGKFLGPWLTEKLSKTLRCKDEILCLCYEEKLDSIIAQQAHAMLNSRFSKNRCCTM
jgi:acetate kinase